MLNFQLKYYGHFNIQELEQLIPFERDLYAQLLNDKLEQEQKAREEASHG